MENTDLVERVNIAVLSMEVDGHSAANRAKKREKVQTAVKAKCTNTVLIKSKVDRRTLLLMKINTPRERDRQTESKGSKESDFRFMLRSYLDTFFFRALFLFLTFPYILHAIDTIGIYCCSHTICHINISLFSFLFSPIDVIIFQSRFREYQRKENYLVDFGDFIRAQ